FPPTPTSAPLAVAVPSPGYAGGLIRSVTSLPHVRLRWRYLPPATPEDSSGASHRSPTSACGGGTFPRLRRRTHPERHIAPPTSACGGGTFPRLRRRTHPERHIAPPTSACGGGTFPRLRRRTHPERHIAPPTSACGGGTFPRLRRGTHPVAGRPLWPAVALESVGNGEAAHWLRTPRNTYGCGAPL